MPLQKLAVVAQMEWMRTYCIAARVPKGSIEDSLLYDNAEAYKYARLTECDAEHDYLIVGGCDHPVGQENYTGRFEELEQWTKARFNQVGSVDYRWSGQVLEPVRSAYPFSQIRPLANECRPILWHTLARTKVKNASTSSPATPVMV